MHAYNTVACIVLFMANMSAYHSVDLCEFGSVVLPVVLVLVNVCRYIFLLFCFSSRHHVIRWICACICFLLRCAIHSYTFFSLFYICIVFFLFVSDDSKLLNCKCLLFVSFAATIIWNRSNCFVPFFSFDVLIYCFNIRHLILTNVLLSKRSNDFILFCILFNSTVSPFKSQQW